MGVLRSLLPGLVVLFACNRGPGVRDAVPVETPPPGAPAEPPGEASGGSPSDAESVADAPVEAERPEAAVPAPSDVARPDRRFGERREAEEAPALSYPVFAVAAPRRLAPAPCEPSLTVTPLEGWLEARTALEGARPAIDDGWALIRTETGTVLLGSTAGGTLVRTPLEPSADRLRATASGVLVVDGFADPRLVRRIVAGAAVESWSLPLPGSLALDSFDASAELAGFVELRLESPEPAASDHVFWIGRPGAEAAPRAYLELGDYVAVTGRPHCDESRCVVVGRPRYLRDGRLRGWTLGSDGPASSQPLSAESVYDSVTVAVGAELYAAFLDGEALAVARWSAGRWEPVGRLDGVKAFSAAADGARLLLAWQPAAEGVWRFAALEGSVLGVPSEVPSVTAEERLELQPTDGGLAAAAYRLEQHHDHPPGPGRGELIDRWTLDARFGEASGGREPAFTAVRALEGGGRTSEVVLAPFRRGERGEWILRYQLDEHLPTGVTEIVAPGPCGR